MAKVEITNDTGKQAQVSDQGELHTISAAYPALGEQKVQPFRQYLTDDGTATGSTDMGIDGSVTNVDFYIRADTENDRYITSLNFLVGYASSGMPFEWADGTALTNGSRLFFENRRGEHDIHSAIKSNEDMFRLAFNPIDANWEIRHVLQTNDYGYFISMDLTKMGLPFGIKLDAGSSQRLICCIRDNAGTSALKFDVIGYGFERFP